MDILNRKLQSVNDTCYFIRASVEEPFVYLRFKGTIHRRYSNKELIMYQISIDEVLEYDKDFVNTYLNRKSFRTINIHNDRTSNSKFYVYDIINEIDFQKRFCDRYSSLLLDMHSSLVFDSESDMQAAWIDSVKHLKDKLTNSLHTLNHQLKNS